MGSIVAPQLCAAAQGSGASAPIANLANGLLGPLRTATSGGASHTRSASLKQTTLCAVSRSFFAFLEKPTTRDLTTAILHLPASTRSASTDRSQLLRTNNTGTNFNESKVGH